MARPSDSDNPRVDAALAGQQARVWNLYVQGVVEEGCPACAGGGLHLGGLGVCLVCQGRGRAVRRAEPGVLDN